MTNEQAVLAAKKLYEQAQLAPTGTVFHLTRDEILRFFGGAK